VNFPIPRQSCWYEPEIFDRIEIGDNPAPRLRPSLNLRRYEERVRVLVGTRKIARGHTRKSGRFPAASSEVIGYESGLQAQGGGDQCRCRPL